MRLSAIVPARSGSKRLIGKNSRMLGDRPLIAWTIQAALKATSIEEVIVSTDSPLIADIAREFGASVPELRPEILAQDDSSSMDVLLHAADMLPRHGRAEPHALVLLQPTSPFRSSRDIDDAVGLFAKEQPDCVVSCSSPEKPLHWYLYQEDYSQNLMRLVERTGPEILDRAMVPNGAIYVLTVESIRKHRNYWSGSMLGLLMPRIRSLDIDTEEDFEMAERLLSQVQSDPD